MNSTASSRILRALLLAVLIFIVSSPPAGYTKAFDPDTSLFSGGVIVRVKSADLDLPIPGARIEVQPLGLTGISDIDGEVVWNEIALKAPINPLTVVVQATGYGSWTLQDVRLAAGDTLIIKPRLSAAPYFNQVPPPRAENPEWLDEDLGDLRAPSSTEALPRNNANVPIPLKIRIRLSGQEYGYHCDTSKDYTIETIDFKDYVKGVLPNEWVATWPDESLRAGAMAAKMYAWSYISLGGKWSDADVWDTTCDQVYNPNFESVKTSAAVDYTWNYVLELDGLLAHTSYRAQYYQCVDAGKEGRCMGQWDSKDLADQGYTWEEILEYFYVGSFVRLATPRPYFGYMLQFNGQPGDLDENRVLIPVDDPGNSDPGPAVDVGAEDFTIEWWMRGTAVDNASGAITCGANENWANGNIVLDRSREKGNRGFGVSVAGGKLALGVYGEEISAQTLCGTKPILDNTWHHIAVQRQRSTGKLWIFVDGVLDGTAIGPGGNISYPDSGEPIVPSDPYLGVGAWKQDVDQSLHPFYRGFIDDLRFSNTLRYLENFTPPGAPFNPNPDTVALYRFDEGLGELIIDDAFAPSEPSYGVLKYGGTIPGPIWLASDYFTLEGFSPRVFIPMLANMFTAVSIDLSNGDN